MTDDRPPPVALEYHAPPTSRHPRLGVAVGCGGMIGLGFNFLAVLAVVSTFYKGTKYDLPLSLALPYATLATQVVGPRFAQGLIPLLGLLLQFPVYGVILGAAVARGRLPSAAVWVGAVHVAAAVLCVAVGS